MAAVRVTGYQGRASGGPKNPYYIRRDGRLVAFTVQLGDPTAEESEFFNGRFGTPAVARISVLRRGRTRTTRLDHRLVRQRTASGSTRTSARSRRSCSTSRFRVKEGNWIAITVPTWAPLLATNLATTNWWRSSRSRGSCEPPRSLEQFAMRTCAR